MESVFQTKSEPSRECLAGAYSAVTKTRAVGCIALMAIATTTQGVRAEPPSDRTSISIPYDQLNFYTSKEGLTFAKAWGDPEAGAHSNFIKMAADTASGLHRHTADYYGVVVAGVVANEPGLTSPNRPLPPGSYWFQKGRVAHVTKCISHTECVFFVTSAGRFDYLPVK